MQRSESFSSMKFWLAFFILATAVALSYLIFSHAHAQITSGPTDEDIQASGITFPIPELGNCRTKDECKNYCNNPIHMDVCISFAEAHGLMNKDEADRAGKFRNDLQTGSSPGGCSSPQACNDFCSDLKNIEVCVQFADRHGVKDKHIEQAKKILAHIKTGGQTPGECTSEASCKEYCGDFSHAEECFTFAKKAGILQARGAAEGESGEPSFDEDAPDEERFQKLIELVKSGQTPGRCTSRETCESYCQGGNHMEECIAFGEQMGFVSHEEAGMIRKSGGKGPGGCHSRESCEAYCNDSAHQEECFKFAEEHGFVRHEEVQRTKEGFVRLRAGLEQAPPEVVECLKSTMGTNVLDNIQSGTLTPGPEIGNTVRNCFEKFGHTSNTKGLFSDAPPEVLSCFKEKLGDNFSKIQSGEVMPTPEMADTFRVCFQQVQFEKGGFGGPGLIGPPVEGGNEEGGQGQQGRSQQFSPPSRQALEFLRHAPPGVSACLKEKTGEEFNKIQSGEGQFTQEFGQTLKSCFEGFKPQDEYREFRPRGQESGQGGFPGVGQEGEGQLGRYHREGPIGQPEINIDCVKQLFGDEGIQSLRLGTPPSPELLEKLKQCPSSGSLNGQQNQQPGGEMPIFNKMPYPQSVPSFNTPPSGSYPGAYPGGQYPSGTTYPSGGTYPSGETYPLSTFPVPSSDPATSCAQAGGMWDASLSHCQIPGSTSPSSQSLPPSGITATCPFDQYWNGSACVSSINTSGGTYQPPPSGSTYGQPTYQSSPPSGETQPPPGANLIEILKPFLFFSR